MRSILKLALLATTPVLVSALLASPASADTQAADEPAPGPAAAPPPAAPPPAAAPAPATTVVVATPAPAPAAPASAAVVVVASTDGTVLVHLETPSPVSLEHRAGPQAAWEHGCDSPCDARMPVGDEYRIVGGSDINQSNSFILDGSKGDRAVLYVAPGSKNRQKIGTGILIGGAVVLVGGVIGGLAAACPSCTFQANGTTDNQNWLAIGIGTGLAVVGLSAGIFGASWLVNNAHTQVSGAVQAAPPARGAADPVYVTGMRSTVPPMTQSVNFPLLKF
jgi:hypothetical protein